MDFEFAAPVWEWRGPAPYYFVTVPADICEVLGDIAGEVSYGWGMIPVEATLGAVTWETSLWPKDGGYVLPLKDLARRPAALEVGDIAEVRFEVAPRGGRLVHWEADDPRQPRNRRGV